MERKEKDQSNKNAECKWMPDPGPAAPRRAANILIIDDDVDAALLVESVFAHLGCRTVCSLSSAEAKKNICSMKADLIIMDWVLDRCTDAQMLVNNCARVLEKFGHGRSRPKIITYSGLEFSEIDRLESPFFEHMDHWKKPIDQRELLKRSLAILDELGA